MSRPKKSTHSNKELEKKIQDLEKKLNVILSTQKPLVKSRPSVSKELNTEIQTKMAALMIKMQNADASLSKLKTEYIKAGQI